MSEPYTLKPVKMLRENISRIEVAKYYLEIEFSKLFKNVDVNLINVTIGRLEDTKIWALLEAISFTYHINGVFINLAREGYTWNEEIWNVKDLISKSKDSDDTAAPLFLNREFNNTKLIAIRKENKMTVLDGNHRLNEMLLKRIKEVRVFVGYPVEGVPEESKKTLIGNSTLILLTVLYKQGNDEEKKAVLTVVKEIISKTIDGRDVTRKFWVDNPFNDDFKEVGANLLKECK